MIFITFSFFNIDNISVTINVFDLRFCAHVLEVLLEGSVSHIFYLGLSFYFL